MTTDLFQPLLMALSTRHAETPALRGFCPMATDLTPQAMAPHHIAAADLMTTDKALADRVTCALGRAILAAAGQAHWRETYKGTDIGKAFLDRFGCYAIIGPGAPWVSAQMAAFMVYMPAGLWYPFHEHPAEELYYLLAGSAEFLARDGEGQVARTGDAVFHASGQPHATRTLDEPMLALVLWRNHLQTPPVLSDPAVAEGGLA